MRALVLGLAVALAGAAQAAPTELRVRSLKFKLLPEKVDIEADVKAQSDAYRRNGMTPEDVAANEKNFRTMSEFRATGADLTSEVKFATDGIWYESLTIAPLMQKRSRAVPFIQQFDGVNTFVSTNGRKQVQKGDQRGLYATLGDALFLYGALPKTVKKVGTETKGDSVIETYEGDLGTMGQQRLKLVRKNGVPVSAVTGRIADDLKHPLATFKVQGDTLIVNRYSGPKKLTVIETYGPERVVPYSPILKFEPGDEVSDQRGDKEYRYAWNGGLQAPPSALSPENPQYPLFLTIAACGVLLVSVGAMRIVSNRRKKLLGNLAIK